MLFTYTLTTHNIVTLTNTSMSIVVSKYCLCVALLSTTNTGAFEIAASLLSKVKNNSFAWKVFVSQLLLVKLQLIVIHNTNTQVYLCKRFALEALTPLYNTPYS